MALRLIAHMPVLLSIAGLRMTAKYVHNWYSPVAIYLNLIHSATIRFKNGKRVSLNKANFHEFREELFRQHLEDHGFSFTIEDGRRILREDKGLVLRVIPDYLNVVDEVFVRKLYWRSSLGGRTVIDVGASIGDTPLYFARLGATKVYAYEVDKSRFQIATENIRVNGMEGVIDLINEEGHSTNITELIKSNGMSNVFLKLDCEGCEYEIISNIPNEIYQRIANIAVEYHKDHAPLVNKLKECGYVLKRRKNILMPEGHIFASRKRI